MPCLSRFAVCNTLLSLGLVQLPLQLTINLQHIAGVNFTASWNGPSKTSCRDSLAKYLTAKLSAAMDEDATTPFLLYPSCLWGRITGIMLPSFTVCFWCNLLFEILLHKHRFLVIWEQIASVAFFHRLHISWVMPLSKEHQSFYSIFPCLF